MTNDTRFIYLHGFASGPGSKKAAELVRRFEGLGIRLEVPDLAEGDFPSLTITRQLGLIGRLTGEDPLCLIGSSLGGYLAALYAARHRRVVRTVLIAPAFRFARRWREYLGTSAVEEWRRSGARPFFHYGAGRDLLLSYRFLEDAGRYEEFPEIHQPSLVFHGERDDIVPVSYSRQFVERRPSASLVTYDSDHQMLDVIPDMWRRIEPFLASSSLP